MFGTTSEDPSCWIAPDGKITLLSGGDSHCDAAFDLGDHSGGVELERKGYLHVSYTNVYEGWDGDRHIPPTQAQIDAIADLAAKAEPVLGDHGQRVARALRKFIEEWQPRL